MIDAKRRGNANRSRLGAVLALLGAFLAFGIMGYRAFAEGVDYTVLSWLLIVPVWGSVAVLALLLSRWRWAAIPLGWLAVFAGVYFTDVAGFVLAAGLFIVATYEVMIGGPSREREQPAWPRVMQPDE